MKELIVFVHANGFTGSCYQQLLDPLKSRFEVQSIEQLGHSPEHPLTENWSGLVDELLSHLDKVSSPVIAIGHSLGGALSLLASYRRPALFKQIIMLDMPIISPLKARALKWVKRIGLVDKVTPAKNTQHRRASWATKEEARRYFRERTLFKQFTASCLDDYLEYGLRKENNAYHLRFNREIEHRIYQTYPHVLPARPTKVPTTLVFGAQSKVVTSGDKKNMRHRYGIQLVSSPGSHMFPMEYPEHTATMIHSLIRV